MDYPDLGRLVRQARSCRRFDEGHPIDHDLLVSLVELAGLSPCANNLQVLRFRILDTVADVERCLAHHSWAARIKDWAGPAVGERPVAYIAICAPRGQGKSSLRNLDAGIAAQTINLASRAAGLACCMVGSFDGALADELGLAEAGYECLLLVALGYPAQEVVVEQAGEDLAYWMDEEGTNHVPKLSVDRLII